MRKSVVILDRDGVINEDSDQYIKSPDEWQAIPGSVAAIARLYQAGYRIAVATNQSGLARGLFDEATLQAMHQKFLDLVQEAGGRVEGIFFCPHGPDDGCDCRKPGLGLVRQIEAALDISATEAWFVGDTDKDLQVAQATGASPILVRTGKGQRTIDANKVPAAVPVVDDLSAAADLILQSTAGPAHSP